MEPASITRLTRRENLAMRGTEAQDRPTEPGPGPGRRRRRACDELDAAMLTHAHALQSGSIEQEGLAFELQTRRLQRERQQLLVEDLERRVGELEIRSPVDGMVGNVAVNQKAAVQQDATLLTVVDLSAFEVEFRVAESYAATLGLAMPAEIQHAGRNYPGAVSVREVEVLEGLAEGDAVIVSDTGEFKDAARVLLVD